MIRKCSVCEKQIWKRNKTGLCVKCVTQTAEARKLRSDRLKETRKKRSDRFDKLRHIPIDKQDDYVFLTRKMRYSAEQARKTLGVECD